MFFSGKIRISLLLLSLLFYHLRFRNPRTNLWHFFWNGLFPRHILAHITNISMTNNSGTAQKEKFSLNISSKCEKIPAILRWSLRRKCLKFLTIHYDCFCLGCFYNYCLLSTTIRVFIKIQTFIKDDIKHTKSINIFPKDLNFFNKTCWLNIPTVLLFTKTIPFRWGFLQFELRIFLALTDRTSQ